LALPLGWTGTEDLAGGVGYSQFLSNLTNQTNDGSLWQLSVLTGSDAAVVRALGTVQDETAWFRTGVDPSRWEIDFVRLTVLQNMIEIDHDMSFADIGPLCGPKREFCPRCRSA
jgi:hypothetical protein